MTASTPYKTKTKIERAVLEKLNTGLLIPAKSYFPS